MRILTRWKSGFFIGSAFVVVTWFWSLLYSFDRDCFLISLLTFLSLSYIANVNFITLFSHYYVTKKWLLEKEGIFDMTTQSELSREWITQALYELLKMKSFSSITNKEITDKAGLSHITIYRLFDSKEEIILKDLKKRIRKSFLRGIISRICLIFINRIRNSSTVCIKIIWVIDFGGDPCFFWMRSRRRGSDRRIFEIDGGLSFLWLVRYLVQKRNEGNARADQGDNGPPKSEALTKSDIALFLFLLFFWSHDRCIWGHHGYFWKRFHYNWSKIMSLKNRKITI